MSSSLLQFRSDARRLLAALKYPAAVNVDEAEGVQLQFDGENLLLLPADDGRIRYRCAVTVLPDDETERHDVLARILKLSFPRASQDDAVLCASDDGSALELWQDVAVPEDDALLVATLEHFLDSRDWWQDALESYRQEKAAAATSASEPSMMFFRP